jgi:hypothetical protein
MLAISERTMWHTACALADMLPRDLKAQPDVFQRDPLYDVCHYVFADHGWLGKPEELPTMHDWEEDMIQLATAIRMGLPCAFEIRYLNHTESYVAVEVSYGL